ncbi:MAG: efflux RND transporter periplasmic adaptor subunit [Caldilineaceae bacterium]
MNQVYSFSTIRKATRISFILAGTILLAGCTFGQPTATPVPFAATPYVAPTTGDAGGASPNAAAAPSADTEAADTEAADTEAADTGSTDTETADSGSAGTESTSSEPVATAAVNPNRAPGETLRYNGEIAAEHQVVIVAETAGMILALDLDVGDRVAEGQMVAQLDTTLLEAQKAQALAGLAAAQAQLDLLQVAPDPEDVAAAEAAVAAAAAAYQRATAGATAEEQRLALAQLKQAEAAVTVAQAGYNQVKGNPAIGALPQSLQLQQATIGLEAAQAQYDKVLKGATQDVIAGAYAQLAQARAGLQRLQEGAKSEQIRAVEAQVKQAEMAVYLAQLQVSKATVKAPVAGIVARVNATEGGMGAPGTPLVTLLSREIKITIEVEEARLAQLQVGQPATIRVDAYPERIFQGEVAIIAPELDAATRTVQVTIRPTADASILAPGMFATVELALE